MKKRIALVVNSLSGGGAERTVSNLSRGLSGTYDVDIVVNDDEHIDYPYEGNIISLAMSPNAGRMKTGYQILAVAKRINVLRRIKKSGNYTAVISFSEMTNLANVLSGNKEAKTIVSIRNSVRKRKESGLKHRIVLSLVLPFVCRKAAITVSCSREIEDDLVKHYKLPDHKSAVIYNGLELPRIREMASEHLSEKEESRFNGQKLIVTVGRMTYQKGQWHLLSVVKKLIEDGLPVQLLILGDGELRKSLEDRVIQLGLSDCVSMPGFVDNPYKYMAHAAAVVMPSLYEGFSNVLIEALSCGAPVISTDHETGAREILAPNTEYRIKTMDRIDDCDYGILVPVCKGNICGASEIASKEETLLADAIKRVLTSDTLAEHYRQAAKCRAEQLSITTVCQQWIKLIEEG